MKVSRSWLKELVDLKVSEEELISLIPFRIQGGIKEVTDRYIELDLKGYNRSDLLSMRGVAKEVAAVTNSKTKFQEPSTIIHSKQNQLNVSIENTKLCPIYCLAKIEGLKVADSNPAWVKKLQDCGMRSINNIADITNLIMLEYGQPLHAFDADKVQDEKVIVRPAKQNEQLITLDNKTRKLSDEDLLIADPIKPLGLAGVMGGKNSEVTNNTTSILLEAAIFDPISSRKTAQTHHLPSEAAKRFQHGLTKTRLLQALNTGIKMYENLGGKLTKLTIIDNKKDRLKNLELSLEKTSSLIGVPLRAGFVEEHLTRLGFKLDLKSVVWEDTKIWDVTIPYWRLDIEIEEDVIEEIARLYGYEKIPAKPLEGKLPDKIDQSLFESFKSIRELLVSMGLTEIQTYSFYSTSILNNLVKNRDSLVKITNPMSSETQHLRDELWPNTLEATVKNLKSFDDVAIFEIGKVYQLKKDKLPKEIYKLSIALSNNTDNPIQELLAITKKITGQPLTPTKPSNAFHPTRCLRIGDVGFLAEIHPRVVNKLGSEKRVAIFEITL